MSSFRQTLTPTARLTSSNYRAPTATRRPVAPSKRFPLHFVGIALVVVGALTFAALAAHGAAHIVAPLNAALTGAQ